MNISTHTLGALLFLTMTGLCAQGQDRPQVQQKGDVRIITVSGKQAEIATNPTTGWHRVARQYYPIGYGAKADKPDKNRPLEAPQTVYVPGLGLVGYAPQQKYPRAYDTMQRKFNFQPDNKRYSYSDIKGVKHVDMPLPPLAEHDRAGFVYWVHDVVTGQVTKAHQETYVIAQGMRPDGLTAERVLYFEMATTGPTGEPRKAEVRLYENDALIHRWEVLNHRRIYAQVKNSTTAVDILPSFIRVGEGADIGHLQFGARNAESGYDLITLDPDLRVKSKHSNVAFMAVSGDQPDYSSEVIIPEVARGSTVFPYSGGRKTRSIITYPAMPVIAHPDLEGLYLPVNAKGAYITFDDGFIGISPIIITNQNTWAHGHDSSHPLVLQWMVAYQQGDALLWGWASPQFAYLTQPIWKDWSIYEDSENDQPFRSFDLREGQYTSTINTVTGPVLMAQLLDGTWQMYVQPNLIDDEGTFDRPNTYDGKIPGGGTYEEAVANGTKWFRNYNRALQADHAPLYKEIVDQMTRKLAEEYVIYKKGMAKFEARMEYIRNNPPPEPRYTTAASYKGMEPSFTNTLRNISTSGSIQRATESLRRESARIRKATGQGY